MQINNFTMNNYQSIIKNNKILADLSINRIEANKLTNNNTIENKIDVSSKSCKNNKSKKSPDKWSWSCKIY